MITISKALIMAILISYGWNPIAARAVVEPYPVEWSINVHSFLANWYPGWKIVFGRPDPAPITVDHEYQHVWHYQFVGAHTHEGTLSRIVRDWEAAPNSFCVKQIMLDEPKDVIHWPHFTLTCLGRDYARIPAELHHYYDWLRPLPVTVISPIRSSHIKIFVPVSAR